MRDSWKTAAALEKHNCILFCNVVISSCVRFYRAQATSRHRVSCSAAGIQWKMQESLGGLPSLVSGYTLPRTLSMNGMRFFSACIARRKYDRDICLVTGLFSTGPFVTSIPNWTQGREEKCTHVPFFAMYLLPTQGVQKKLCKNGCRNYTSICWCFISRPVCVRWCTLFSMCAVMMYIVLQTCLIRSRLPPKPALAETVFSYICMITLLKSIAALHEIRARLISSTIDRHHTSASLLSICAVGWKLVIDSLHFLSLWNEQYSLLLQ